MLMTILRPLINPTRRIAVPAVASIMITFSAVRVTGGIFAYKV